MSQKNGGSTRWNSRLKIHSGSLDSTTKVVNDHLQSGLVKSQHGKVFAQCMIRRVLGVTCAIVSLAQSCLFFYIDRFIKLTINPFLYYNLQEKVIKYLRWIS